MQEQALLQSPRRILEQLAVAPLEQQQVAVLAHHQLPPGRHLRVQGEQRVPLDRDEARLRPGPGQQRQGGRIVGGRLQQERPPAPAWDARAYRDRTLAQFAAIVQGHGSAS